MLFNKNFYRKAGDKKVLHKVGKQWKVVSVALLMALGGGAAVAATNNANANADATDNAYNDAQGVTTDTAAQAQSLEDNNYYGGSAKASVAPKSASKVTVAPSFANINYAPSEYYAGNNASAASYKNNESYDNANMNYYGPIVRGYVDQINAQFPEARSLEDNYNDLQGKTNEAKSAANSYSATAQNSNTANVISAKASATNQTASNYVDSVAYNVLHSDTDVNKMGFIPKVSYVANEASQDSVVESYANLIYDINNNPTLSEEYSASADVAGANYNVASAYASNAARYVDQLTAQSSANNNDLIANINDSIALSGQEEVAKINSGDDAQFVSTAASNAGFKYSSSVVSSAVSAIASAVNSNNEDNYAINNSSVSYDIASKAINGSAYFKNQASVGADQITFYGANNSSSSISLGNSSAAYGSASESDAVDFIVAVSDTATQSAYDAKISGMNSSIATEKANQASYANAISAANDTLNKAKNSLSAASSAYQADFVLGHNPTDYDIFNEGNVPTGTVSLASFENNAPTDNGESAALKYAGLNNHVFSGKNASEAAVNNVKSATTQVSNDIANLVGYLNDNDKTKVIISSSQASMTAQQYATSVLANSNITSMSDSASNGGKTVTGFKDAVTAAVNELATKYSNHTQPANALQHELNSKDINTGIDDVIELIDGNKAKSLNNIDSSSLNVDSATEDIFKALAKDNPSLTGSDFETALNVNVSNVSGTPTVNDNGSNIQHIVNAIKAAANAINPSAKQIAEVNPTLGNRYKNLLNAVNFNAASYTDPANASTAISAAISDAKTELNNLKGTNNTVSGAPTNYVNTTTSTAYEAPILNSASYQAGSADMSKYVNAGDEGDFTFGANDAVSSASNTASDVASVAASAGSNYKSVSSASASYAKATDQDVTIASQFNSYYNSIASSDATLTASAKASLDTFRATHASNPEAYTSASDAYANAAAAKPNDRDFAYAYGKNVLLNTPEYVTVTKNAMLHNDTQYAKSNSVESVKAGTQFAVKGVGFDLAGNVRYVVADHKGENLYLTANDEYVRNTYLAPSIDYTVTLAKPAVAHSTLGFIKDAKGTIPANTQLEGYTVPTSTNSGRRDAAYGVTRLQVKGGKFNGDYITTNGKYFSNVTENNSNNAQANAQNVNPVQHTINFAD